MTARERLTAAARRKAFLSRRLDAAKRVAEVFTLRRPRRDPLEVLEAAMLDAADRGDLDAVANLRKLATGREALADWLLTLPPDVLAAGE